MDPSYLPIRVFGTVLTPGNLLLALLVIGSALSFLGRGRVLVALVAVTAVSLAILPTDAWLLRPLEDRFPAPDALPEHVDGIIVLGGAVVPAITHDRGLPALNEHAERMTAFVALARRYPAARLAFTGGSAAVLPGGGMTESAVAHRLFDDLGLDSSRIVFEDKSRNTYENAVMTWTALAPAPGETWVLVTSAFHLPRAMGAFRHAGWAVLPWPVDYQTLRHSNISLPNFSRSLSNFDLAIHEWLGLVGYRILGRTGTLFPGPAPTRGSGV